MICCQIHDNGDSVLETQATGNRVSKIMLGKILIFSNVNVNGVASTWWASSVLGWKNQNKKLSRNYKDFLSVLSYFLNINNDDNLIIIIYCYEDDEVRFLANILVSYHERSNYGQLSSCHITTTKRKMVRMPLKNKKASQWTRSKKLCLRSSCSRVGRQGENKIRMLRLPKKLTVLNQYTRQGSQI